MSSSPDSSLFAGASLVGGFAHSESLLIGARFVQGMGAAILSPAALSTLTTTFRSGRERATALGAWAAVSGLGGAVGVLFGGLLTEGPGWRWVLWVNVPFAAIALVGAFVLLKRERGSSARLANFDALGAFLVTGGMLLLVYSLVKAPDVGWEATRTIGGLALAGALLAAFVVNELRVRNPLLPMSILRVKGVAVADATQLVTAAGFLPMFFFLTLYMQTVLDYSPIQTGLAYLPLTAGFIVASSISSQLFARIGTKPVIVVGAVIASAGLYWLSRIPVDGSYVSDILPGLLISSIGLGGVFVGATTAANAGVSEDKAGLAAGLLNTGTQLGAALGLADLLRARDRANHVGAAGRPLDRRRRGDRGVPARPPGRGLPDARRRRSRAPGPQHAPVRGDRGGAGARPRGLDQPLGEPAPAPPSERRLRTVHRTNCVRCSYDAAAGGFRARRRR